MPQKRSDTKRMPTELVSKNEREVKVLSKGGAFVTDGQNHQKWLYLRTKRDSEKLRRYLKRSGSKLSRDYTFEQN